MKMIMMMMILISWGYKLIWNFWTKTDILSEMENNHMHNRYKHTHTHTQREIIIIQYLYVYAIKERERKRKSGIEKRKLYTKTI